MTDEYMDAPQQKDNMRSFKDANYIVLDEKIAAKVEQESLYLL